jgi:hypothetical protein
LRVVISQFRQGVRARQDAKDRLKANELVACGQAAFSADRS